ncbi:tyrosine-type recombinase/integrase [Saccharothrix coeruleofusca]|uniref:Site-specific integrase n=1 Tax=Saccharothrix coeruleofusca TaxID=33919 RepID=A0A918AIR6_9PSEU|nr:site-specific integrase [Saccharothrix coeruleofusca]GGP42087.1 site-specific integrase [Saccharothrix coeruleofusca]
MAEDRSTGRKRGRIEERGSSLRVKVYAGIDPVTGKRVYLNETVPGTDRAARKKAEKALTRLLAEADAQRAPTSSVTLAYTINEWLKASELEDSTEEGYRGYIDRTIVPALGSVPISKLTTRTLETFYADLRRCRVRCDGKPHVDHKADGDHDCKKSKCKPHACKPMAASTVRQIHSIISGALNAAVRWDWLNHNPAQVAKRPKQKPPQPDPPSPADAARLIEAAFEMDEDWGTLVWLVMTTGLRRGEVCALRWSDVDFDTETLNVRRSYRLRRGVGVEKDTKTHQMRRIALDSETVVLLRSLKRRLCDRLTEAGTDFDREMFLFGGVRRFDPYQPYSPHAVSSRYKDMAERLGIKTHIHALRHYSATELLTAGVDLRTVAGRLGHGGGGATTLRVYAAWVAASDRKAAEILGSRMPKRGSI